MTMIASKLWRGAVHTSLARYILTGRNFKPIKRRLSTSTTLAKQILSTSSTFIQDGVEINEIPIIVRHTDLSSLGSANKPLRTYKESEDDVRFKQELFRCQSVSQVLKLLNMPVDQVTAHSAAYALQRLVELHATCQQNLSTFIQTAVLNELCDTATRQISFVSNSTLIDLVQCALVDNFMPVYVQRIREETERRIGDSRFDLPELCTLIHVSSGATKTELEIRDSLWVHLGNRAQDMNEKNLVDVYSTVKLMTSKQKYLLEIFSKRLHTCWWKLTSRDFTRIVTMSSSSNHRNFKAMNLLGKWAYMNIRQVSDIDLAQMIAAYSHFHYNDKNFMNALERYITENIWTMNIDVVALAMEYLRQLRHISPRIFDVVAAHFERYSQSYNSTQLLLLLRPYGQLNYEPPNVGEVFQKLEDVLLMKFDDFTAVSMVELLSSFVYLRRLPLNFINKVFNTHFLSSVNAVTDPAMKGRMSRQLKQIQCAVKLEMQYCHLPYLYLDSGEHYLWLDAQQYTVSQELLLILQKLIGHNTFSSMVAVQKTPYHADFEITVDSRGNISPSGCDRIAVTILMPEFFCSSHHHLLGEYVMRQRHLRLLGYKVVQVLHKDYIKCTNFIEKANYIASLLRPHINNIEVYWDSK